MPLFGRVAVAEVGFGPSGMWFTYAGTLSETKSKVVGDGLPRSSRTRLSSSAILLRRRVVSSMFGSSLSYDGEDKEINTGIGLGW